MSQQEFEEEMDLLFSNPKIINKKDKDLKEKDIESEETNSESDEFDDILEDPDWNIDNMNFTNESIDDDDCERLDDEEEFYDDIYDESDD